MSCHILSGSTSADPGGGGGGGGGGGIGGSGPPPPGKSQVIWVSIEISIWTPLEKSWTPLENVGHPLDPWKSIVFSVIKPLDPLCKL